MLHQREERLYALWVAYFTAPFSGDKRKTWDEFYKESTTVSKTSSPEQRGTYKGVDLVKASKK